MAQPSTEQQQNDQTTANTGAADAPSSSLAHSAASDKSPAPEQLKHTEATKQRPSELLLSLLAAAIGVQSSANREKDFQKGRAVTYIIAGSVGTILFIVGLVSLVQFILKNAS